MKTTLLAVSFLLSTSAFADSAKFSVAPFKGELSLNPSDLKITTMTINARLQHCNFWGTTCAGGPSEEKQESVSYKIDSSTNLVKIELNKSLSLKSMKPMNRFSSCNLTINMRAVNAEGEKYEGYVGIIHENDKDKCGSSSEISEQIAEKFKTPQKVNFWRSL